MLAPGVASERVWVHLSGIPGDNSAQTTHDARPTPDRKVASTNELEGRQRGHSGAFEMGQIVYLIRRRGRRLGGGAVFVAVPKTTDRTSF